MHTLLCLSLFHFEVKKMHFIIEPTYTIETELSPYYMALVQ